MYNQLPQLQRILDITNELEHTKSHLHQLVDRGHSCNTLCDSFSKTMSEVIFEIQERLGMMQKIDDDVFNNNLVPCAIDYKCLMFQSEQIPQWFDGVFQKEFVHQKKNFDIVAKKIYQTHNLKQHTNHIVKQFEKFKLLSAQYEDVCKQDKNYRRIISEVEMIRNKVQHLQNKYMSFLNLITSKIVAFLRDCLGKSMQFHNSMKNHGQRTLGDFHLNERSGLFDNVSMYQSQLMANDKLRKSTIPTHSTLYSSYYNRDPFQRPDFSKNSFYRQPSHLSVSNRGYSQNHATYLPTRSIISDLYHN